MKMLGHPTALAARTELVNHKYVDVHARPGMPQLWAQVGKPQRLAIECKAPCLYDIVDYATYAWLELKSA